MNDGVSTMSRDGDEFLGRNIRKGNCEAPRALSLSLFSSALVCVRQPYACCFQPRVPTPRDTANGQTDRHVSGFEFLFFHFFFSSISSFSSLFSHTHSLSLSLSSYLYPYAFHLMKKASQTPQKNILNAIN